MLDMAALMAEENRSALMDVSCVDEAGAGSEEAGRASRLPEAHLGTEPESPATCEDCTI